MNTLEYTLKLNKAGMDTLVTAVSELPYRVAKPLLDLMMAQFIEQERAAGIGSDPAAPVEPPSV